MQIFIPIDYIFIKFLFSKANVRINKFASMELFDCCRLLDMRNKSAVNNKEVQIRAKYLRVFALLVNSYDRQVLLRSSKNSHLKQEMFYLIVHS